MRRPKFLQNKTHPFPIRKLSSSWRPEWTRRLYHEHNSYLIRNGGTITKMLLKVVVWLQQKQAVTCNFCAFCKIVFIKSCIEIDMSGMVFV